MVLEVRTVTTFGGGEGEIVWGGPQGWATSEVLIRSYPYSWVVENTSVFTLVITELCT